MMMESQETNPPPSTTTTTTELPPNLQPPHDFLSMMATAVPEDGMDPSKVVGPMSLGSALSSQQVRHSTAFSFINFFNDVQW